MGFLELTGTARRSPGPIPAHSDRAARDPRARARQLAVAAALLAALAVPAGQASAGASSPQPADLRCIEGCAAKQSAAVGSTIRIAGDGLRAIAEVRFEGRRGRVATAPRSAGRHRVVVRVPRGAETGYPQLVDRDGAATRMRRLLRVVPPRKLPERGSFKLRDSSVRPHAGFVDSGRSFKLRYRFRAFGPVNVTVKLKRRGHTLRTWTHEDALPYSKHRLRWKGSLRHRIAGPGRYRFAIKAPGREPRRGGKVRLRDGKFPVRGPHSYGGAVQRFGAPRSGGRVHEGQDVFSPCGTRVVAARGGRVQARGSDPVLYGNWIVIDARGTSTDYRYAHFKRPASVHDTQRVRTGEKVGLIGRTGNARSVGCMLHFEVWPHGWERRRPTDPLPILRRWDGWS